jgi:6-pyruvoyltetrahydropterin/6-carboxytetrahydropterin synthase
VSTPHEVRLIRRVSFSSGHRYWLSALSAEENRRLFGPWASPYSHGHNYVLEAEISGAVDAQTGMVVNIKILDAILQEKVVSALDGKSLNDEIPHFADHAPSVENILLFLRRELGAAPDGTRYTRLTVYETPLLWGALRLDKEPPEMTLTRSFEFAASHRLHNPLLPQAENDELYGKCNNPAGHGHNYVLEVTVSGEPDSRTGMLVDLAALDRAVEAKVVDRYDHKNLSEDLPEFRGKVATSEVVAQQIWKELDGALPAKLEKIRLLETARNIFEISR